MIRWCNTAVIICFFLLSVMLSAATQRGPFFSLRYYPVSYAVPGKVPYNEEPVGTVSSTPSDDRKFTSFQTCDLSAGYFYSKIMGRAKYSWMRAAEYRPDFTGYPEEQTYDYTVTTLDGSLGVRFSRYGDASYTYLYGGYRRFEYTTDYLDIEASGNGVVIGYTGFYCFGLTEEYDYVLYADAYAGSYPWSDYDAENITGSVRKTQSVTFGGTLGTGVQYEPMNITVLVLASYTFDQISHRAGIPDGHADFGVRHAGAYFGIGVMYQNLNFKYNR